MFNPDQPVKSRNEDLLGRASFSQSLGKVILRYKEKDSLVIGLFGEWGSGKTSIINMALEEIEKVSFTDKDTRPIIVKFNPWNFSDQQQLISQFFKQLSAILKRDDYASAAKKAGEKLETYAGFFEPLSLIPAIGTAALILSKLFKGIGTAAKGLGKMKEADLDSIRKALNDLLYKLPMKIIVVIDDIDRLNNNEIRQIFQLVKSLGDFPNTIYLLAFEKQVVINALSKVQEGSGSEYLEKVVQVPFEIPLISKQEVEYLLLNQLDTLIKDIPESRWDQTYWGNIYHSGLRYFFKNIRDVTRYINSLRFSLELVKEEVTPIDFLAITGLQVFTPDIYYGIRDNKDIFTGSFDSTYGSQEALKEQALKRCDEILFREGKSQAKLCEAFIAELQEFSNGTWQDIDYFQQVNLKWDCGKADTPYIDINPSKIRRLVIVGHIYKHMPGLDSDEAKKFHLDYAYMIGGYQPTFLTFNQRYRFNITIAAENADSISQRFELNWSGVWKDDPEEMFKEIRIESLS